MLSGIDNIGLGINQDIPAKILPTSLGLKKRRVVGLYFPSLLDPSVGRVSLVSAYIIYMVSTGWEGWA